MRLAPHPHRRNQRGCGGAWGANLLFVAGGRPFGVSVPGYFGYLPDISFAVEGNRILLQLQADVNGV